MEKLVSIITPCYNGEKYLEDFLDSLLAQTYNNIEFIFIDDGSKDATKNILFSYQEKFRKKGIHLIYLYQRNQGQAAALNVGLKHFKGEYLTWPDSDDIMHEDNIRLKVKFLGENTDCKMVLCESPILGKHLTILKIRRRIPPKDDSTLFRDIITENNVSFAGGAFMFDSEAFL